MNGRSLRIATAAVTAAILVALALPATGATAAGPPRGNYMCWSYANATGFPLLAAQIWILGPKRYAGPGKKFPGRYRVGGSTRLGRKITFVGGAYRGWWAYFRRTSGTPVLDLFNRRGRVADGACPRARS